MVYQYTFSVLDLMFLLPPRFTDLTATNLLSQVQNIHRLIIVQIQSNLNLEIKNYYTKRWWLYLWDVF